MTQKNIEYKNNSDSIWLITIVIGLLLFFVPMGLWVIFKKEIWSGLIILIPMILFLLYAIKELINLKIVRITDDIIIVPNFWTAD
ncbi:MAG: hypothetical protein FGM14_16700 [Flavobacteriales bacterium]|nr:hypothetical protein [Flavobacteriales bacterium]